ncbi:E3 ubiquitin-protein ligase AIP2 [Phragmites australis]|uniref:E3 ubiquitin-protein ligase AIP2 n=1 Tax=Phragmites australis TaxID=29695 RepID=UPI002D78D59A|nr:E3 ubiquitin-protein ligase AIP2 [Phragmites australis]
MSAPATDEAAVEARLQALRQRLGKKQHFEEAVAELAATVRDHYAGASPALRKSMYSMVCRVATVLQTRYTAPGFWRAGLNLLVGMEKLVTNPSEKEHLKTCISRAREHLDEKENEDSMPSNREADSRFLFEGHLTVGPEPPPPAWLVAQNLALELSILTENSGDQDGNNNRTELRAEEMAPAIMNFLDTISGDRDLETALEESLQGIMGNPPKVPPASKEVVANLPVITVTDEVIARLGSETECAVCRENLVVDDKMQELPCKHLFHPPCLKPWLDENNSCPICRHELRTDDHVYESRKEREREEEEDRRGAANAVRGGEFMYI